MARRSSEETTRTPQRRRGRGVPRQAKLHQAKRHALLANVGAIGAGAAAVALASSVGVGELMAGGFVAFVAYRVIRYGIAPTEAVIEGVQLEHGEAPKNAANVVA